jgi:hypothetical protein
MQNGGFRAAVFISEVSAYPQSSTLVHSVQIVADDRNGSDIGAFNNDRLPQWKLTRLAALRALTLKQSQLSYLAPETIE